MSDLDTRFMLNAIELSRRGLGATAENPPVGCVIAQQEIVVGRGFTAMGGRPHAETIALAQAGAMAQGATAYVTLEPCFHHGQTSPCSQALINAGISRVVCAVEDPDDRVSGKGLAQLRSHNIEVLTGICRAQATKVLAGYLSRKRLNKPLVLLKLAISADKKLATNDPDNRWITGALARNRGHLMRSQSDAIVVGVGTVIADDPDLTCRLRGLQHLSPLRVIVDTKLRTPVTSHLVQSAREIPVMIACSQDVEIEQSLKLFEKGVEIIPCADKAGRVDLTDLLAKLAAHGVNRVLFEGGAKIAAALIEDQLIDQLAIFTAPFDIGVKGTPAFASITLDEVTKQLSLVEDYKLNVGGDQLTLYHQAIESD
jgi:diaminohydroxyphosphoribosylaminopyrimidine deaminase / 5-amino-6-(5-phosphoribosylamino)uracil reductase